MMKNKKIFITGGAGFLGKNLVRRYYKNNEITIYSRDEAKHYYLKKEFPNIKCIIGDIRNYDLLKRASIGHDIGIFAASLKQIGAVDQNVEEGVRVLIDGALNSRRVAEENNFESACFISSDKSRAATTLYGAMKFVAGESFIVNAEDSNVRLSTAVYGNVLNSTGSIIPLIWDALKKDYPLTLYSEEMTRFMIDIEEAMDLIELGLKTRGYNIIPNLKAFKVKDLFEIYQDKFNLKYTIGKPRISEKLHEMMISKEETSRTYYEFDENTFYMHYKDTVPIGDRYIDEEFTSDKVCVSKEELTKILEFYNYFKP
jgi:UDP-N-acetylglucosamine 4,6-dehydratase/5-epimerase